MKIFNRIKQAVKLLRLAPLRTSVLVLLLGFFAEGCTDHVPPGGGDPVEVPVPSEGMIYVLSEGNYLFGFDLKNTTQAIEVIRIETQFPTEKILSIDFRPATGQLFALSNFATLYAVNVNHNRLSKPIVVNPRMEAPETVIPYKGFGFDFDPVLDKIWVATGGLGTFRLNPDDFRQDEENGNPMGDYDAPTALAFTNNYSGAESTKLYGIDDATDELIRYEDKNATVKHVVGSLGQNVDEVSAFDISPRNSDFKEFGLVSVRKGENWELHTINLESGKLRKVSDFPVGTKVLGLAIPTPVAYAVDKHHKLLSFSPMDHVEKDPHRLIIEKQITGIPSGEKILGIDLSVEPSAKLYALASNSRIYRINPTTGVATEKCRLSMPFDLTNDPVFGVDFNPYNNQMRVVNSTKHAFSVNIETGAVTEFGALTLNGDPVSLDGIAYSNSQAGLNNVNDATLFAIDSKTRGFYRKDPNQLTVTLIDELDLPFDKFNGFDIAGKYDFYGYGLFKVNGQTGLYEFTLSGGRVVQKMLVLPYDIIGFTLGQYLHNQEPT